MHLYTAADSWYGLLFLMAIRGESLGAGGDVLRFLRRRLGVCVPVSAHESWTPSLDCLTLPLLLFPSPSSVYPQTLPLSPSPSLIFHSLSAASPSLSWDDRSAKESWVVALDGGW